MNRDMCLSLVSESSPACSFDFGGAQMLGSRENQQDFYAFVPPDQFEGRAILCVLADGMGGYEGGEIASEQAVRAFVSTFLEDEVPESDMLSKALEFANRAVGEARLTSEKVRNMGTTLCAAYICGNSLHYISVGDSLLFLYRRGKLHRINRIHTVGQDLSEKLEEGKISLEEFDAEPQKNCLTSALVGEPLPHVDYRSGIPVEPEDVVLLSSDGVLTIGREGLAACCSQSGPASSAVQNVRDILNAVRHAAKATQDNASVALIKIQGIPHHGESGRDTLIIKRSNQK